MKTTPTIVGIVALFGMYSCKTLTGLHKYQLTSNTPASLGQQSTENCAGMFPLNREIDLLAGENLSKFFFELPDKNSPNGGWHLSNHTLIAIAGGPFSQLVTNCRFENFELYFDWVITTGGNSGVKYLVDPRLGPLGLEYQLLDDERHPDSKIGPKRQTGALYDLYSPDRHKQLNQPGELNRSKIAYINGEGEHWLNDKKILTFKRNGDEFQNHLDQSKFRGITNFATGPSGHLLLQHHGDQISFKKLILINRR